MAKANEERREANISNDLRLSYMILSTLKCKYLGNLSANFSSVVFCNLAESNENSVTRV